MAGRALRQKEPDHSLAKDHDPVWITILGYLVSSVPFVYR